ncbi:tetratricopeptide repeat protein [Ramlibacter henchirensis]|uniref:Tetratricopeptide repeat protein n=1 Tax=Ramlibacter henchirensis TaxID=204072 RepID=A0A4Z0BJC0_9BURK|nr:protein arginine N-methyltransferase [Ramlibacter henchirensis]TFY99422.1 tetratricopeptide repeat protein [Ramlibacter henchirensis]
MNSTLDRVKQGFREGRHAQAIAECEALCRQEPSNLAARRLCAKMHALTGNYTRALELFRALRNPDREDGEILFNIGACEKELKRFDEAAATFATYTDKFPNDAGGWANLADCKFQLNEFDEGLRLARKAIGADPSLAPELARSRVQRGDSLQGEGRLLEAAADYKAALAIAPGDAATLKKATTCLLESNRGPEAIELCRDVLRADPDSLTAKLGAEWLLSQMVPIWHVPMMNEQERNGAFHAALQSAVSSQDTVLEIGTGSGLLAMMAARLGAKKVFTCEAVPLVADTATRIVERNGYADRVTVLAKPSQAVQLGQDLPGKADVLVHEIFSSELLGENVLSAIEDAKVRLLKPGGKILPAAASIMVALVTGEDLAKNLHVAESFGFDLSQFNAIQPRKRPLYREDLAPALMSEPVEAFRFDFLKQTSFPAEKKRIQVAVTQAGVCHGLIQWIRLDFGNGIVYENHPSARKPVSNWQHTIYAFEAPVRLEAGSRIAINAWHDRSRPWFERAAEPAR